MKFFLRAEFWRAFDRRLWKLITGKCQCTSCRLRRTYRAQGHEGYSK